MGFFGCWYFKEKIRDLLRSRSLVHGGKSLIELPLLSLYAVCRMDAGFQKVLQVDLEVNGLLDPLGTRSVTWQVEYPMTRTLSEEIYTLIRLAPHDLGGIVPLAMVSLVLQCYYVCG